jgi:hypothetical protein
LLISIFGLASLSSGGLSRSAVRSAVAQTLRKRKIDAEGYVVAWLNLSKHGGTEQSPYAVKMMTRQKIERAIAMRRYAWKKPTQQIADEAGLNVETINRVLRKETVSSESYAKLTTYLRTPAGPRAMINDRAGKAKKTGKRSPVMAKVMRLVAMAHRYGLKARSEVSCAAMTQGELLAYFYRLEFKIKEAMMVDPRWSDSITGKFVMLDALEPWQWAERLDQLSDHQSKSSSRHGARPAPNGAPSSSQSRSTRLVL